MWQYGNYVWMREMAGLWWTLRVIAVEGVALCDNTKLVNINMQMRRVDWPDVQK